MKKWFSKKNIIFISLFTIAGLIALQIPLFHIVGSGAKFTVFDCFGPLASGFIGLIPGVIAVFFMQAINLAIHGFSSIDTTAVIRLFPMLFAAMYFGKKTKLNFIVPLLAMLAFNLNPIGRSAWYYSLYWLIPVACYFLQERFLLAKALGATFTAHSIGSTAFLYAFALPKAVWISLIPVVALERSIFAVGIVVAYLVFNNALNYLVEKKIVKYEFLVNKKYVWKLA